MKNVKLFNVKYSPNLGDGLLVECLEKAILETSPDLDSVSSIDLAGRLDFGDSSAGRGLLLRLLNGLPSSIRNGVLKIIMGLLLYLKWLPFYRIQLQGCDGVVIGGGNLFTDMDYNFPVKLYGALKAANERSLPVAIYAVGAGKEWSAFSRRLLRKEFANSHIRYVSARDLKSKTSLNDLFGDLFDVPIEIDWDPGLLTARYRQSSYCSAEIQFDLGLSITSAVSLNYHSDLKYNEKDLSNWYASLVEEAVKAGQTVCIFTNGSPEDVKFCNKLLKERNLLHNQIATRPAHSTPAKMVETIASCDCIIAHRLHAIIPAFSLGKKIIGLTWDRKVKSFFEMIEREECCFDVLAHSAKDVLKEALHQASPKAKETRTYLSGIENMMAQLRSLEPQR